MKRKIILSVISSSILIIGCTKPPLLNHEVLKLDLVTPKDIKQKINKTIVVLKAKIKILKSSNSQRMDLRSQVLRMQANIMGGNYDFGQTFKKTYGAAVSNALKDDVSDILSNEGFIINTEYESYDDIDFSIKKNAYLILQPSIEISFITSNVEKETVGDTMYESGLVSVIGYVKLKYLEPLSKTQISIKKINIDDLNNKIPYTSIRKIDSAYSYTSAFGIGKAIGKSIGNALFSPNKTDNIDEVLISIINKIEAYSINKVKPRLQKENILSYEQDINEIKANKRY